MKKNRVLGVTLSVFGAMAVASLCAACGGTKDQVTLDNSAVQMDRFEQKTLKATAAEGVTVSWSSSDPSVATVDSNGVITSLAAGSATITASTEGGGTANCKVTVVSTGATPVLTQGWTTREVSEGESVTLEYALTYKEENVTANAVFDSKIEKSSVLKEESGKLKALAAGESKVTLSVTYNGWKGSTEYLVKVSKEITSFAKPSITLTDGTVSWTATDGAESYTLKINDTEFNEVTGTSVDLLSAPYQTALNKGNNAVALKVNATENKTASEYSDAKTYVHQVAFPAPVISISGVTLSWAAIPEAESYTLKIGDKTFTVTGTSVALNDSAYAEAFVQGDNAVSLKANAVGNNLESAFSEAKNFFYKTPFAAVTIAKEGDTVSWAAVTGATGYVVKINDTELAPITANSIDLTACTQHFVKGENKISVKVNSNDEHLESAYSNELTHEHFVPFAALEIALNGSKVSWTAPAEAEAYTLKIDDKSFAVTETEIDLTAAAYAQAIVKGAHTVTVVVDAAGYNLASPASNAVTYTHTVPFAAPEIALTGSTVSWQAVEGATSYTVTIGTAKFEEVTETSFDLLADDFAEAIKKGENAITVRANANEATFNTASEDSNQVTYTHKVRFAQPTLTITGDNATWAAEADAAGYKLKINNGEPYTVTENEINLLDEKYAGSFEQGEDNQISVCVVAKEDSFDLDSEFSEKKAYFFKSVLDFPAEAKVTDGVFSWNAVADAVSYTIQLNGEKFGEITETSVNLLEAPYLEQLIAEQNEISVKANANEGTHRPSKFTEPTVYNPLPEDAFAPKNTAAKVGYLPSYKGVNHVLKTTVSEAVELTILDEIQSKYADKEYVYFDIFVPEGCSNLVGFAYCTAHESENKRHNVQAMVGSAFNEQWASDILLYVTTNQGKKLLTGWNTIAFKLTGQKSVGVLKYDQGDDVGETTVYVSNIRFTEERSVPDGVIAPKSPNATFFYDEFEGKQNVFQTETDGNDNNIIKIFDRIQESDYANEILYFDVWIPAASRDDGFTVKATCIGKDENSTNHNGQWCPSHSLSAYNETNYKLVSANTLPATFITNNGVLQAGWNTVRIALSELTSVGVRKYSGSMSKIYIANIRFTQVFVPGGGIIVPESPNEMILLDEHEGKTNVFQVKNFDTNSKITILHNIPEKYSDKQFVYFDIWIPSDFGNLTGTANCDGKSAPHSSSCNPHTSEIAGARFKKYGTIFLHVTNSEVSDEIKNAANESVVGESLVKGAWNTIAFEITNQNDVGIIQRGGTTTDIYVANIRFAY